MHEEYKKDFFKKRQMRHKMRRTQRKSHQSGTFQFNKILLPCFDDKQYILDDGIKNISYRN